MEKLVDPIWGHHSQTENERTLKATGSGNRKRSILMMKIIEKISSNRRKSSIPEKERTLKSIRKPKFAVSGYKIGMVTTECGRTVCFDNEINCSAFTCTNFQNSWGFFSVKIKVIDNLEKSTFSFPILGQLMTTITKQREDEQNRNNSGSLN